MEAVAGRFGDAHHFSVHQVETYIDCPFRFFAELVLGVEETETPAQEFDPRVRGMILHSALETLHREFAGRPLAEVPGLELEARARSAVAEAFDAHAWKSAAAPRAIAAVEQRRMEEQVARYVRIECQYGEPAWKPSLFELSFGRARGDVGEPPSTKEPFVFHADGFDARFAGRIDRIDLGEPGGIRKAPARIIDYKTSSAPSPGDIKQGYSVQLTVYAWAVEQLLLPGAPCASGAFAIVGKRASKKAPYREAIALGKDSEARETQVRARIQRAITEIRAGRFPPVRRDKKQCSHCPHQDACRFERARIERKTGVPQEEEEDE